MKNIYLTADQRMILTNWIKSQIEKSGKGNPSLNLQEEVGITVSYGVPVEECVEHLVKGEGQVVVVYSDSSLFRIKLLGHRYTSVYAFFIGTKSTTSIELL